MAEAEGKAYVVHAEWDEEAGMWVATSDDVPGLVTEGATLELLVEKLRVMVPEMLELNGVLPPEQAAAAPFRLVAERLERPRAVA
jgi:predicted RNase H-like HicB family nuclease